MASLLFRNQKIPRVVVSSRGLLTLLQSKRSFSTTTTRGHAEYLKQLQELQEERQELFGFTQEEKTAWCNHNHHNNPNTVQDGFPKTVAEFLDQHGLEESVESTDSSKNNDNSAPPRHHPTTLTHISQDSKSVEMVNVGTKQVTKRMARARTRVVFPPEVLLALKSSSRTQEKELVGPKGPIFATAQLAGIMAAKRTSDLIPLCHPLPLDKVNVDISLDGNAAVIDCECHVTHTTGVEMEALTGASVAALTIYDMVKAVSHRVVIEETVLVKKTGGKRNVDIDNNKDE